MKVPRGHQPEFTQPHFFQALYTRFTARQKRKSGAGFTLIELLVYLGMSSIVVVVISVFMVDISQSAARTRAGLDLQNNSRLILNRITQTVRTGTGVINFPPSDSTNLVIPMPSSSCGTPPCTQMYSLSGSDLIETLPSGAFGSLNSQETAIKSFAVTNQGIGVSIALTIGTKAILNPPVQDYSVTSMIVPRQPLYQ